MAGVAMIKHEYLSEDRSVQKTTFANKKEVIVNFGTKNFEYKNIIIHPYSTYTN